jgi:hypothetical protein
MFRISALCQSITREGIGSACAPTVMHWRGSRDTFLAATCTHCTSVIFRLERGEVAHSWRTQRWDSLQLLTPNWMTRLPAYSYRGADPDGYLAASDVVQLIEGYAKETAAPVRANTTVTSVRPAERGYVVQTDQDLWHARSVVLPTGRQHRCQSACAATERGVRPPLLVAARYPKIVKCSEAERVCPPSRRLIGSTRRLANPASTSSPAASPRHRRVQARPLSMRFQYMNGSPYFFRYQYARCGFAGSRKGIDGVICIE